MAVTFAGFDLCDLCLWGNLIQSLQNNQCILKAFTAQSTGGYSRHHAKLQLVTQIMSLRNILLYFRTKIREAILISGKGIYFTEPLLELGRNLELEVRWCELIDAVYENVRFKRFRIVVKSASHLCHVRPFVLQSFFLSVYLSTCLSFRLYRRGSHWTYLSKIWYWMLSPKSAEEDQIWLKSGKNFGNLCENQISFHDCQRKSMAIKRLFSNAILLSCQDSRSGTNMMRTATLLR
jgi:hypothetical protein